MKKTNENTLLKLLDNSFQNQIDEIKNIQNYIYIYMHTWNKNSIKIYKDILSTLQDDIWNHTILKIIYRKANETKEVILFYYK